MVFVRACEPAVAAKCSTNVAPEDELASVLSRLCAAPHVAGEHRFPADRRLLTGAEFDHVFAAAERSSDRYFTILARRNELGRPRLGLAISKRAAKRAVDRNRLKRIARECFRAQPALAARDYVVLARPAACGADGSVLRQSLERLFGKAGAAE